MASGTVKEYEACMHSLQRVSRNDRDREEGTDRIHAM
jgi:hypothetical protein